MTTRSTLRWAAAVAVLALGLAGCSSSDQSTSAPATSTTPSATASASASATTTSATASASARPTASATTAAPSPSATTASAQATDDAATSTAVAAPGTKCGPTAHDKNYSVYVFGGRVSCSEATRVMNEYQAHHAGDEDGSHGHIAVGSYDCYWDVGLRGVEARNGFCTNKSTGAYIDSYPTAMRILPGNEDEPAKFQRTATGSDYQGRWISFMSPNRKVGCGIGEDGKLNCWSMKSADPGGDGMLFNHVTMVDGGAPVVSSSVRQDAPYELQDGGEDPSLPLDQGTTINAIQYSCQPISSGSIKCLSPKYGFTITEQGVVRD